MPRSCLCAVHSRPASRQPYKMSYKKKKNKNTKNWDSCCSASLTTMHVLVLKVFHYDLVHAIAPGSEKSPLAYVHQSSLVLYCLVCCKMIIVQIGIKMQI